MTRTLALLGAAVLAGCALDPAVPADARISCASTADCPPDFVCRTAVSRCVRVGSDDVAPVIVAGSELAVPSVGGADREFRLQLLVTERLAEAPAVTVTDARGAALAGLVPLETSNPLEYAWAFRAAAATPPAEGPVQLFVNLVDEAGNTSTALYGPRFAYDLTAPGLVPSSASLRLNKAADNPLDQVGAMSRTTVAELAFALTEPATRVVVQTGDPALVARQLDTAVGNLYRFELSLEGTPLVENVPLPLSADLEDAHGNRRLGVLLPVDGLRLDATPPPLPVDDDRLLLSRRPWGSDDGTPPGVYLAASPGSFEPSAVVRVTDGAGARLLEATADPSGGLAPLSLGPVDRDDVFTTVIDGAGNQAGPQRVRDVEWLAGLVGKTAGSATPNPHRLLLRPTTSLARDQPNWTEVDSNVRTNSTVLGVASWVQRSGRAPPLFAVTALAWAPARGRLVAWGQDQDLQPQQLREWNAESWLTPRVSDPEGDGEPAGTGCQDLAWDAVREEVVLYCVTTAPTACETWVWNSSSWRRAAADPGCQVTGTGPFRLTWAPGLDKVLAVSTGNGRVAAWDGAAWALVGQTFTSLSGLNTRATWDEAQQRLVLVRGAEGDALVFHPFGDAGTVRAVIAPPPFNGSEVAAAWNPERGRVQVFQHSDNPSTEYNVYSLAPDAGWEAEGRLSSAGRGIDHAGSHAFYSRAHRRIFLLQRGGTAILSFPAAPDGGPPRLESPERSAEVPEPRAYAASAYVQGAGVVVHGGRLDGGAWASGETWVWNGQRWANTSTLGDPPPRWGAAAASDSSRLALFGGSAPNPDGGPPLTLADAWAWTSAQGWALLPNAPADAGGVPARTGAAMAWDPLRQAFILAGGLVREGLPVEGPTADGLLTDAGWAPVPTPLADAPSRRRYHAAFFDPVAGVCRFGPGEVAQTSGVTTWFEWSDDAGAVAQSADQPLLPARSRYGLAWDDGVGGPLLYGGQRASGSSMPDPAVYRLRPAVVVLPDSDAEADGRPPPRLGHAFAYDRERRRVVAFGGEQPGAMLGDVWEFDHAGQRPSALFEVELASLRLPAGATVTRATVVAAATGKGGEVPVALPGVEAEVWTQDGFRPAAAGVGASPSWVLGSVDVALERLFRARRATVRWKTLGANGTGSASLTVSAPELQVRYRWPAP